ncbi:MAG: hypothetical protein LC799_16195 [Actinobacteria bacterium]|nr:hypothetical protein [Actinomycetota bacterium]
MSGSAAAWVIPLALIYVVTLLVVAFEPHRPRRRGRHRRDRIEVSW